MTLVYFRLYVTQPFLSYLFWLDDSNISREISQRMLPALLEVLPPVCCTRYPQAGA